MVGIMLWDVVCVVACHLCACVFDRARLVSRRLSVALSGLYVVVPPPPSRGVFPSFGMSSVLVICTFALIMSFLFVIFLSLSDVSCFR